METSNLWNVSLHVCYSLSCQNWNITVSGLLVVAKLASIRIAGVDQNVTYTAIVTTITIISDLQNSLAQFHNAIIKTKSHWRFNPKSQSKQKKADMSLM